MARIADNRASTADILPAVGAAKLALSLAVASHIHVKVDIHSLRLAQKLSVTVRAARNDLVVLHLHRGRLYRWSWQVPE